MTEPVLHVEDLTVEYVTEDRTLTAVSGATFRIRPGSVYGMVGESGSGKSTLANAILRCLDGNGRISSGTIRFDGRDITDISEATFRRDLRWSEIAWIPQGSMNSLDPLERIRDQAIEIGQTHTDLGEAALVERIKDRFLAVGLPPSRVDDYPHQFSGGMQQRAIIALSLLLDPSLVIADEPTTALDVIIQDQIFESIESMAEREDLSVLLITHDLSVVLETCDELSVLHSGQIAESGPVTDVYDDPHHPYTARLLDAFPDIRHPDKELEAIDGAPPEITDDGDYCTFAERCPVSAAECRSSAPELKPAERSSSDHHRVACVRTEELRETREPVPTRSYD